MMKLKYKSEKIKGEDKSIRLMFFLTFIFSLFTFKLYACPMCGDILERGKDAVNAFRFSAGISWSILLMLSVPYLMVGGTIFVIWRAVKNKKKEDANAGKP